MYAGEIMDAKKAMPPEKLSELWNIDPKRAKRFFFFDFVFVFSSNQWRLAIDFDRISRDCDFITGF